MLINYIWFFILVIGIVVGLLTGRADSISKIFTSASSGTVQLLIEITGSICLWSGVMKVAQKSGLTDKIAIVLRPILRFLFKEEGRNEKALGFIIMNITANMMGISNAATPFGIKAMEEMQKYNNKKDTASNDMALFLVLNAACIQFVPTTILSFRAACNSKNPGEIIIPAIITTTTAALVGVITSKLLQKNF